MRDYQESVTTGQTDRQTHGPTDAGQSDPYVPLCFAGNTIKVAQVVGVHQTTIPTDKWTCAKQYAPPPFFFGGKP